MSLDKLRGPHLTFFRIGAAACALAVLLGAFGAHSLKTILTPERLQTFETAVRYQFFAALGMQLASLAQPRRPLPLQLLLAGMILFSGSLYLLVATDVRWLGAITPLGGLSMIAGWALLAKEVGR